ncbi:hypothetical protein BDZ97DRAFT_1824644 [Flammula alnicola]|nr:hypothetical protein BDZ97DRAFT_1824644 [Flammula alnicola]
MNRQSTCCMAWPISEVASLHQAMYVAFGSGIEGHCGRVYKDIPFPLPGFASLICPTNPRIDTSIKHHLHLNISDMHGSHSAGLWHPKSNASGDQLQQPASSQDTSLLSQGTPRSQPRLAPLRHVQHVANYEAFWLQRINSVSELPGIFPPHPITADKVAIYIQDELLKPGATSNIKEVIDALDLYRFDHLLDPPYLDYARDFRDVSLRSDVRIRQYEAEAARLPASGKTTTSVGVSEPAKSSIPSSVAPLSTPRITIYDMSKLFMRMLQDDTATLPHSVHANIRERAWVILSRGVAPCLDSRVRLVLWSDLDFHSIAINGCVRRQQTLFILSDNGRMNDDDNKLWIHGAIRHRLAEMCSVGALGFYFYSYFHILKKPPPDFAPDFSEPTGEYGRRKWYLRALFPRDDEDDRKLMSLQHCFDRTRSLHSQVISGAGGESQLKSADYELYNAGRSVLQPPATLINSLFPWINDAEAAYRERLKKFKHRAQDLALVKFLTLLYGLRKVILQDAAVLFLKYPNCNMFKYEPFDSVDFRTFIRQCKVFYREMGKRQAVWKQESLKVVNSPPKPLEEKMRDVLEVFDDIEMDDDTSTLRSSLAAAAAENTSRPNGQAQLPPPRHTRQSIPAKPSSTFTAGFFGEIVR